MTTKPTTTQPPFAALRDLVEAARVAASRRWPYLSQAIFGLRGPTWVPIGTAAVDEGCRLYLDPGLVARLGDEGRAGVAKLAVVLAHEALHPVRGHADRARTQGVGPAEKRDWNVAADCEINGDLQAAGVRAKEWPIPDPCLPEQLGLGGGLPAEEYYRAEQARKAEQEQGDEGGDEGDGEGDSEGETRSAEQGSGQGQGGDVESTSSSPSAGGQEPAPGHAAGTDPNSGQAPAQPCESGATGIKEEYESKADEEGVQPASRIERELIAREVARAVRDCGSAPGGLRRWAEALLAPPSVPWQQVLSAAVRRGCAKRAGCADYSADRPSRRSAPGGIIRPRMVRPIPSVALVVDTSGSMGEADLTAALSEVQGVIATVGGPCPVVTCDTLANAQRGVRAARKVQLQGGGGTDIGVGIRAALDLRPRPDVIVVLTDCCTPWPPQPPKATVIVARIGSTSYPVPSWARVVAVRAAKGQG
jgi:predicted metal-dependent peptidase